MRSHRITSMVTTTHRRNRATGRLVTIQGEPFGLFEARAQFMCYQCLSNLKILNHGVRCDYNTNHYGLISRELARQLSRGEIMTSMLELFPNQTEHNTARGGIDLVDGPQVWTIKEVKSVQAQIFQSKKKAPICLITFKETNLTVRIPVSFGRPLQERFGHPDNWTGKRVKVYDAEEQKPGAKSGVMHLVTRLTPTQQQPGVDISSMSKLELMGHCKLTLKVFYHPYDSKVLGALMAYVLGQSGMKEGDFNPQTAYNEMRSTGESLHKFLTTFDDYVSALDFLVEQAKDGLAYSVEDEDAIVDNFHNNLREVNNPTMDELFFDKMRDTAPFYIEWTDVQFEKLLDDELGGLRWSAKSEEILVSGLNEFANKTADLKSSKEGNEMR